MTTRIASGLCMRGMRATMIIVLLCLGLLIPNEGIVAQPAGLEKIQHVIVIYQENWSFDGLYGRFPGADGIANADKRNRQVKKDGTPYAKLPQPLDTSKKPPIPDARFPTDLPIAPYDIAHYVPPDQKIGDIVNRALQEKRQINGGQMDGFVAWSENGGLAMSYYDATNLPVGRLAQQYTVADRFFHSAFDGSLINHLWLVCACTPMWSDAPANLRIEIDAQGTVVKDGSVTGGAQHDPGQSQACTGGGPDVALACRSDRRDPGAAAFQPRWIKTLHSVPSRAGLGRACA